MAEIIRIDNNTWRVEDGGVRFFVLEGEKAALMIDSGMNTPDARDIVMSITKLPLKLINTHADPDHIAGNAKFDEFYMHPAELANYPANHGKIIPVSEGDVIDLGGRKLTVIDLPGHTPGSIALLDDKARVLYSGDAIQDGHIFMFGKMRSFDSYIAGLEALSEKHLSRFDRIYPSHGSLPVDPSLIPKLISAAKDICSGAISGKEAEFMGNKIKVCDFGFASFLCPVEAE